MGLSLDFVLLIPCLVFRVPILSMIAMQRRHLVLSSSEFAPTMISLATEIGCSHYVRVTRARAPPLAYSLIPAHVLISCPACPVHVLLASAL